MGIIAKTAANEVAIKLTAGKQKDLNEKENSFREFCTVLAESKVPRFIAEAHKKSPEFFPEAVPFLPSKTGTSLVIDILKLRKSLK